MRDLASITPPDIFTELQKGVLGQGTALRYTSVAVYKHTTGKVPGNILLIGNSGTGKTTIMRAVERFYSHTRGFEKYSTIIRINANLVADLASRGKQTNVVMDRLAQQAAKNLGEKAALETMRDYVAHGIVCVDEVDKIRAVVGGEPNVKGIVAQDSLLTLMENEDVQVEIPYFEAGNWHTLTTAINTEHILFVAGGAFEELYEQVYNRASEKSGGDSFWKLLPRADGTLERRFVFDFGNHLTQSGKVAVFDFETRITAVLQPGRLHGVRIPVHCQQPSIRSKLLQDCACMSTTAEGTVHIYAVSLYIQSFQHLCKQHGPVCVFHPHESERQ